MLIFLVLQALTHLSKIYVRDPWPLSCLTPLILKSQNCLLMFTTYLPQPQLSCLHSRQMLEGDTRIGSSVNTTRVHQEIPSHFSLFLLGRKCHAASSRHKGSQENTYDQSHIRSRERNLGYEECQVSGYL